MRISIGPRSASSLRRKRACVVSHRLPIEDRNLDASRRTRSGTMTHQAKTLEIETELAEIPGTAIQMSRVAIGTWAIGGWMWGGTDEAESISTIRAALDHGINLIDKAPVYGFGRSEEIVGKAIAEARLRSRVLIATKTGLEWQDGKVFRN